MRKTDSAEILDRQMQVYETLPDSHKPANIERTAPDAIRYDFVEGDHCRNWLRIHSCASKHLWDKPGPAEGLVIFRSKYYSYVWERAQDWNLLKPWQLGVLLNPIMTDELTPVMQCHGDLTFANVISEKVVFIDPGHPRGLPCKELDEAKLMQSMDGFDEAYRGWEPMDYHYSFPARRIHFTLLATHYIRMLRHVDTKGRNFARTRITDLAAQIHQATYYNGRP